MNRELMLQILECPGIPDKEALQMFYLQQKMDDLLTKVKVDLGVSSGGTDDSSGERDQIYGLPEQQH